MKELNDKRKKLGFTDRHLDQEDEAIEQIEHKKMRREEELQEPFNTERYHLEKNLKSTDQKKHKK